MIHDHLPTSFDAIYKLCIQKCDTEWPKKTDGKVWSAIPSRNSNSVPSHANRTRYRWGNHLCVDLRTSRTWSRNRGLEFCWPASFTVILLHTELRARGGGVMRVSAITRSSRHQRRPCQQTPWSRVLLERLKATQSRNSLPFTESEGSLPCAQQPATGSYPEPDESSPHLPTLVP
jgi:hypothetical protein